MGSHEWTRPLWQAGRVLAMADGNGDIAFWRMTEEVGYQDRVWVSYYNISADYDDREEMGR